MKTILFSAPYMSPFLERFRPVLEGYDIELIVPEVQERLDEEDLLKYAGKFDGAICGDDRYTARVIEACAPRLKVISKWGTGVDSIDAEACSRYGIKIGRTPNAFTTPVADTVLAYMLAFARRQPWMDNAMKAGDWVKIPGKTLSECTLGVVGVGNIGKAVTRRARAFGMKVLGADIVEIDHVFITETGIQITTLQSLLSESDFVSLNCDLNPTSRRLMNAGTFALMKPSAVLINTARGSIVDEKALIEALQTKQIAAAGLVVVIDDPVKKNNPLLKLKNVVVMPHRASKTYEAQKRTALWTVEDILRVIRGEKPRRVLNPEVFKKG